MLACEKYMYSYYLESWNIYSCTYAASFLRKRGSISKISLKFIPRLYKPVALSQIIPIFLSRHTSQAHDKKNKPRVKRPKDQGTKKQERRAGRKRRQTKNPATSGLSAAASTLLLWWDTDSKKRPDLPREAQKSVTSESCSTVTT